MNAAADRNTYDLAKYKKSVKRVVIANDIKKKCNKTVEKNGDQ